MSAKPAPVEAGLLGRESGLLYHAVMTTLSLLSGSIWNRQKYAKPFSYFILSAINT
jgi:hypothetical protein